MPQRRNNRNAIKTKAAEKAKRKSQITHKRISKLIRDQEKRQK